MTFNVRDWDCVFSPLNTCACLLWVRHDLPRLLTPSFAVTQAIGAKLHNHLQSVIVLQDHLRVRERRHRKTAENNLARVANWSLFEMVVVMVVGFAQVVAIRRFFKDRDGGKPAP